MEKGRGNNTRGIAILAGLIVALILVLGTAWMGSTASRDTEKAVRSVSLLYLDELAGRREQVVSSNLDDNIDKMNAALSLLTAEDLSDADHLRAFQARMRRLYGLEKFAFVDADGLIYTADGTQDNIAEYSFDPATITGPEISILNLQTPDKKVVIAVPVEGLSFEGKPLVVCFMEIDMSVMLQGVSMRSQDSESTFCNIYTEDGVALSNTVLGGLAVEDNLLEALQHAEFEPGYSLDAMIGDFRAGVSGQVSFTYDGIRETLSYAPVKDTNWFLTYLIRESVISAQIGSITGGIIVRSVAQSALIAVVLAAMFILIFSQQRRNAQLLLEKETGEAASRAARRELEEKLALKERGDQQSKLITALAADYRSVYYIELDRDEGVCYQSHEDLDDGLQPGERFNYLESFTAYADSYIPEPFREEFMRFIQPEAIREGLKNERVISYRYMVRRHGHDSYEMVRFAGVRHPEDRDDHLVHAVGACFTNVDAETRKTLEQSQALSDALAAAQAANRAKTAFLSSMSHEIRTPMNAIIGLDNIALNDPDISDRIREYLEKIGSSASHLLALINDILDMSRIESGRMTLKNEDFSFSKLLEQINVMFSGQCNEKGLKYSCAVIGHVDDHYIGDSMKLRQVLINILGNAVKFTPEGGSVAFTVERVAQFDGKSTLRFVTRDTGIGMSAAYLPHIFDTFSQEDSSATNQYGSSGLGLAITRSIVQMMNGDIAVESEKGVGSTFTVTVTLLDSERDAKFGADEELRPQELNVLVVDDDPIACEHAKLVLEKVGIATDVATSGAEAVEMVRLRHARRDPYRLILIDWQMPGLDGVETTRQIRSEIGEESAIVILTAYKWDDVYDEAIAAGVDSFLPKPLFASSVLEEFESALKKRNLLGPAKREGIDLKGRRILLAEDVDVNAEIMTMVLQIRGMEVELARNGRIAVEMFASHPVGHYDAVLMDIRMPEMDGLEATARIRGMDRPDAKAIPIIALTANAFDEDVQRSLQAGMNAHLSKPIDPGSLFETLESLIR